ncbi:MAG: hypothetical protein WD934_01825 [Gemmatimonadales bacterium]
MSRHVRRAFSVMLPLVLLPGCGDPTDPTEVTFGETTIVVIVNPQVNDVNEATLPAPGTVRSGVTVSITDGPSGTTNTDGVVVLAPVEPGTRILSLNGGGLQGTVTVTIVDRDLREVAVALTAGGAGLMTNVRYAFGGAVVEVTPTMTIAAVNEALAASNSVVFFGAGTYTGDLVFSGSNVTLFGVGAQGGQVTLNGSVTVEGSGNRIRGARITGILAVPGSNFGLSFSRVSGEISPWMAAARSYCAMCSAGPRPFPAVGPRRWGTRASHRSRQRAPAADPTHVPNR